MISHLINVEGSKAYFRKPLSRRLCHDTIPSCNNTLWRLPESKQQLPHCRGEKEELGIVEKH